MYCVGNFQTNTNFPWLMENKKNFFEIGINLFKNAGYIYQVLKQCIKYNLNDNKNAFCQLYLELMKNRLFSSVFDEQSHTIFKPERLK